MLLAAPEKHPRKSNGKRRQSRAAGPAEVRPRQGPSHFLVSSSRFEPCPRDSRQPGAVLSGCGRHDELLARLRAAEHGPRIFRALCNLSREGVHSPAAAATRHGCSAPGRGHAHRLCRVRSRVSCCSEFRMEMRTAFPADSAGWKRREGKKY